jgi:hypothetical protein
MPVEVGLIADETLPKSMLPSRALVPLSAARVHPFRSIGSRLAALRDHPLMTRQRGGKNPHLREAMSKGHACGQAAIPKPRHKRIGQMKRSDRSRKAELTWASVRNVCCR